MIILILFICGQSFGLWLFAHWFLPNHTINLHEKIQLASQHGTTFALTCLLSLIVIISSVMIILQQKNPNPSNHGYFLDYLALQKPKIKDLMIFTALLCVLNGLSTYLMQSLQLQPLQFMNGLYQTAEPLWLLVIAITVIVPIYEEIIFRGFMWLGIANSRLGFWGATIVSSLIFTIIHAQYTGLALAMIFLLAMLFGLARAVSGSLILPILLHITNNSMAMLFYLFIENRF